MILQDDVRHALCSAQAPSGAIVSTVDLGGRTERDENGFVTAQVLRAIAACGTVRAPPWLTDLRERAADYLVRCQYAAPPGAFGFWPPGAAPAWAGRLPPDADDTAVFSVELARLGRLDRRALLELACRGPVSFRVDRVTPPAPPWLRAGAFRTWLRHGSRGNVVDCCVNANVVALCAVARAPDLPGVRQACEMIEAAIRWAGPSAARMASLCPFYPDPAEFCHSLSHAVGCGATELAASLRLARAADRDKTDPSRITARARGAVCGSAYGAVVWKCDILHAIRRCASADPPPG